MLLLVACGNRHSRSYQCPGSPDHRSPHGQRGGDPGLLRHRVAQHRRRQPASIPRPPDRRDGGRTSRGCAAGCRFSRPEDPRRPSQGRLTFPAQSLPRLPAALRRVSRMWAGTRVQASRLIAEGKVAPRRDGLPSRKPDLSAAVSVAGQSRRRPSPAACLAPGSRQSRRTNFKDQQAWQ